MQIYLVGGAVRDELLGLPVKDRDWVVVGASPEQMIERGYQQVGKDFPVFIHPQTGEEYALARTERKSGQGYAGFSVYAAPDVSLQEDLKRRDLTINAMALDKDRQLIDPYDGKKDLDSRVLRHVSAAFSEDPLRLLRLARFYARFRSFGFTIASDTEKLLTDIVGSGELHALVPERIWQEMQRALEEDHPQAFFETLLSTGALAALIPELVEALKLSTSSVLSVSTDDDKQHTQNRQNKQSLSLAALAHSAADGADLETRWAVLLHNLKCLSPSLEKPPNHDKNGRPALDCIDRVCERFKCPNSFTITARQVCMLSDQMDKITSFGAEDMVHLFESLDALRRPIQLERFSKALESILSAQGTANSGISEHLANCFNAYSGIDAKTVSKQAIAAHKQSASAHPGDTISQAIRKARTLSVAAALNLRG